MNSVPANLTRVPMALSSQVMLNSLSMTQSRLLNIQVQMSSGKRISRPSDDIIAASLVNRIANDMDRREHRIKTLDHADAMLGNIDQGLGEISNLILEAKTVASEMANSSIDPDTRKSHALVVDSYIDEIVRLTNGSFQGLHYFGGERTKGDPIIGKLGGYEFLGTKSLLGVDVGLQGDLSITISADDALGAISSRVQGNVDLNPELSAVTRIKDLNGAQGDGVTLGVISINLNGLDDITVDLTSADSIQDAADMIENAIEEYETDNTVTLLGSGGAGVSGTSGALTIDVASGVTLTFSDALTGRTATDLGLSQATFTTADSIGEDLDPRLNMLTQVSDLQAVTSLGVVVISNGQQNRNVDLSSANTIQDILNLIEAADVGVRFEISEDGSALNALNQIAGVAMSIYSPAGEDTADQLGLRSFRRDTSLTQFNQGNGVQILSGQVDPVSGNPDPMLDRDFVITLRDGMTFDVDLAGANTVGDVIDIMNAAGPASFTASVDEESGGLSLEDTTGGTGNFSVVPLNGSFAANDLGILKSVASATITGEDRAKIEVDSLLTHLIALRDALEGDDIRGITLAGGALEDDVDRIAQSRAEVGQRMSRVSAIRQREEDENILDASLRSQAEDLDFAEASVQFAQLQTFLQASLTVGAQSRNLSLLDFLG